MFNNHSFINKGWKRGYSKNYKIDTVVINKDGKNKFIHKDKVNEFLNKGWKRGSGYKKIGMNNGKKNKWTNESEIEEYKSKGWKKGWLKRDE